MGNHKLGTPQHKQWLKDVWAELQTALTALERAELLVQPTGTPDGLQSVAMALSHEIESRLHELRLMKLPLARTAGEILLSEQTLGK